MTKHVRTVLNFLIQTRVRDPPGPHIFFLFSKNYLPDLSRCKGVLKLLFSCDAEVRKTVIKTQEQLNLFQHEWGRENRLQYRVTRLTETAHGYMNKIGEETEKPQGR